MIPLARARGSSPMSLRSRFRLNGVIPPFATNAATRVHHVTAPLLEALTDAVRSAAADGHQRHWCPYNSRGPARRADRARHRHHGGRSFALAHREVSRRRPTAHHRLDRRPRVGRLHAVHGSGVRCDDQGSKDHCSSPLPPHGLLGRGRHARIPSPVAGRHAAARLHLPGLLRAPFRAEVGRHGNGGSSEFLIPLNTQAKAAQMPWLVITAGMVAGFAYLFRFVILPPRPARVLSRSIAAFYIRAATVLDRRILSFRTRHSRRTRRSEHPQANGSPQRQQHRRSASCWQGSANSAYD